MKNKQKGFIGIAIIVFIALAAIGSGVYVYTQNESSTAPVVENLPSEESATSSNEVSTKTTATVNTKTESVIRTETKVEVKTETQISSSDPWAVIEKYKTYIKARDLAGLNSISYKSYPPCASKEECDFGFGFLESGLSHLYKSELVNRWEDNKQIILTTDVNKISTISAAVYRRDSAIFTKDVNGNLKLVVVYSYSNNEEDVMTDSDKDGLTDQEEKCEGASKYRGDCKVTDPSKRDTDGDGWWDGVEAKF